MFTAGGPIYLYTFLLSELLAAVRSYDGKHTEDVCRVFRGGQARVPDGYCGGEKLVWF